MFAVRTISGRRLGLGSITSSRNGVARVLEHFKARSLCTEQKTAGGGLYKDIEPVLLYKGNQEVIIRSLMAVSGISVFYWGFFLFDLLGKAVSTNDAIIMTIGWLGTAVVVYFTRHLAHNSIRRCYVSPCGTKIQFEMYSLLGKQGETVEIAVGKTSLVKSEKSFGSYVPIRVEGKRFNFVFAQDGTYYDRDRLFKIVAPSEIDAADSTKQQTVNWMKQRKGRK